MNEITWRGRKNSPRQKGKMFTQAGLPATNHGATGIEIAVNHAGTMFVSDISQPCQGVAALKQDSPSQHFSKKTIHFVSPTSKTPIGILLCSPQSYLAP